MTPAQERFGFYAPWCDQPDEVPPMTDEQSREAARRTKELMERKRREERGEEG